MATESIKLEDNELLEIKSLQSKFQDRVYQLGNLYLEKMNIDAAIKSITQQEEKIISEWVDLKKQDQQLVDKLLNKYGEGQLNIKDGVFIKD